MKLCPHCSAELRDSVIKCVHCGRSLAETSERAADASNTAPPGPTSSSTGSSSAWAPPREEKLGWWSPNASKHQAVEDVQPLAATDVDPEPTGVVTPEPVSVAGVETQTRPAWTGKPDAWAPRFEEPERAATTIPRTPAHGPESRDLRALPTERRSSARLDFLMLLAGAAAIAVAVVAWQSIAEPWVQLRITDMSEREEPVLVGEMVIRGRGAVIGTIAQVLTGVMGALGIMWFLFGLDRGWTMRWFASPGVGLLTAIAGLTAVVLSTTLWFVWEDAAVQRARAVGKTPEKLQDLLNQQPPPLVEIVRQPGLLRFGVMMGIGLLAACVAMAAANKRG